MDEIRLLRPSDLGAALQLSTLAGWNQTAADWQTLLHLDAEGCLTIDGVATTTLLRYDSRLAWLGMVLTHPEFRGRGFARSLVSAALEHADRFGVATVKLDATEQGLPIYQSLGFRQEQPIERWAREAAPLKPASIDGEWDHAVRLDRGTFGVDRSAFFRSVRERAQLVTRGNSFLLLRPGSRAQYLGPFVAQDAGTAQALLKEGLANCAGPCFWDLFPSNSDAVALARHAGFKPVRRLVRMARGAEFPQATSLMYGIAGFEFG